MDRRVAKVVFQTGHDCQTHDLTAAAIDYPCEIEPVNSCSGRREGLPEKPQAVHCCCRRRSHSPG